MRISHVDPVMWRVVANGSQMRKAGKSRPSPPSVAGGLVDRIAERSKRLGGLGKAERFGGVREP